MCLLLFHALSVDFYSMGFVRFRFRVYYTIEIVFSINFLVIVKKGTIKETLYAYGDLNFQALLLNAVSSFALAFQLTEKQKTLQRRAARSYLLYVFLCWI